MNKFFIAGCALTLSIAVPAQELLRCVNPHVLNALLFNGRVEARVTASSGIPEGAKGFGAPAGFALIGSALRGQQLTGSSLTVAYKTDLEPKSAVEKLVDFLSGEGWAREAVPQPTLPPGLAVTGLPQLPGATLCRNGERRSVLVHALNGVGYATISGALAAQRACGAAAPGPSFQNPMADINVANANMPRFSFPETARTGGGSPGFKPPPSGGAASEVRIQSPDTAQALSRHLAAQLVQQGWRSDAEWSGKLSTGSTWSRQVADGRTAAGTLEILSLGAGVYDVGFGLTVMPR